MTSPKTLDLGLLLCDDVPEDGRERFGNYTGMFDRALGAVDNHVNLTPYDAYKGVLPTRCDAHTGYLISGSGASVFENKQWIKDLMEFVKKCFDSRIKAVGICFGHQLIAHALGGKTIRSENGWGFGIHSARLTETPAWLDAESDRFKLVVIHQDQVVSLPSGFTTIASNDFCPNSMITDNEVMLGIQGHPEFSKEYCAYRAEFRRQILGEDKYQEAIDLLENNETDSHHVFGWISQFMRHPH